MKYIVVLGRVLYSAIFIFSGFEHFLLAKTITEEAARHGVPLAQVAVPVSGVIAVFGGISILLGYYARVGAWLIVIFLVPVTLMLHNFWAITDPRLAQTVEIMFMKNISMLGAALMIAYFGSGPLSLDACKSRT